MRVRYDTRAIEQLGAIWDYIAEHAGDDVATRIIDSIFARCQTLTSFPRRGTPRDEIYPGLRTIPHRRRYMIGYLVHTTEVVIVGVQSAGQDLDTVFGSLA